MLLTRSYPTPDHEISRLAELRRYQVLDTPDEPALDATVALACTTFGTEIGLVSMIDDHRQWFKARAGWSARETDRADAVCNYTILGNDAFVVGNAAEDSRFARTRLVTERPQMRFYAGAPLTTPNGLNIGTLCVIDSQARTSFSPQDRRQLLALAQFVMGELNRRIPEDDRRQRYRHRTQLKAIASAYGLKPTSVEVENLSLRGALIRFVTHQFGKGDELILTIGRAVVVATVAWANADQLGLSFHRPLSTVDVAKFGQRVKLDEAALPIWQRRGGIGD